MRGAADSPIRLPGAAPHPRPLPASGARGGHGGSASQSPSLAYILICNFTSLGPPLGGALEGGDAFFERERLADQRLEIDLAGGDHRQRAVEHIGVAEYRLDADFLVRRRRRCRASPARPACRWRWAAARPDQSSRPPFIGARRAARLEHDVGAPAVRSPRSRRRRGLLALDVDGGDAGITPGDGRASRRRYRMTMTREQPPASAASAVMMPIGPAPVTTAVRRPA